MDRRDFIKIGGLGFLATSLGYTKTVMAGPFTQDDARSDHLVPPDKKLDKTWINSLYLRGNKEVYSGKSLETIGMPCGGIGSGMSLVLSDFRCRQHFKETNDEDFFCHYHVYYLLSCGGA